MMKNQGFTLIEIMVAMLVLSIGFLGLAGLQATSMRNNNSANVRSIASLQVYDIVDRMRSNPLGVSQGSYNNLTGIPNNAPSCGAGSNCNPASIAQMDNFEWNTANATLLPNGQGTVSGGGTGSVFTVTLRWDDNRTGATGTGCDATDPADLSCLRVDVEL